MLLALSGITGVGKSYFKNKIVEKCNFQKVHTIRTRPKRSNEVNFVDGYFMTPDELDNLQNDGKIAYRFHVFNGDYAYLKSEIFSNDNMVFEMHYTTIDDWKNVRPDLKTIYIFPTDIKKAKEQLKMRNLPLETEKMRVNEILDQYNFMMNNKDFQNKFDYVFFNNYDIDSENRLISLVDSIRDDSLR